MPQKLTPEAGDAALAEVQMEDPYGKPGACTLFTPNEKTCRFGLTLRQCRSTADRMGVKFDWRPGPCE